MELTLNIVGFLVCALLTWGILRSAASDRRSYVACIAIALVCVSLIFPAISMTDDLSIGILTPHDDTLPQLKFWMVALQLALFSVVLLIGTMLGLREFSQRVLSDDKPLLLCAGCGSISDFRAPPIHFV